MIEVYPVLKFIHVIAAIAWVGGDIMLLLLVQQVRSHGTPGEMAALLGRIERFSKTLFAPLSVVVLAMGIWMSIIGGLMSTPWVGIGFLGIIFSAGIGMAMLAPQSRRLKGMIEARGTDDAEVTSLGNRLLLWSRIDTLVLVLVVAAMVLKPGM